MSRLIQLCAAMLWLAQGAPAQDPQSSVPATPGLDSLSLEQLMQVKVVGAALHPQTLQDAPASVTIITAEDIRKYGYRTLGEALSGVRGFYLTSDRSYQTIGVRGFSLPGDYDSHILVMINGHNMADNIFDYMLYMGHNFPLDMNLIKQIEIIRGPSSALYGSNAMFATINIITKSPDEAGPLAFTADFGSFGEKKVQIVETASFGSAKFLLSGSVYNITGESPLFFPEYNNAESNYGKAVNMTGEKGYHFFSTLVWRNWTITAAFSGDSDIQPISWGPTIFNDRGTRNDDLRNFIDVAYQREIAGGTLRWRTYYDSFHYEGRGDYALPHGAVEDNRQSELGDWIGTEVTYRTRPFFAGNLTLGVDSSFDIRAFLTNYDVSPVPVTYLSTSQPDRTLALFLQDEKKLSKRWRLDMGLRMDKSKQSIPISSPRGRR